MVVADALMSIWNQGICNHHNEAGRFVYVRSIPTRCVPTNFTIFPRVIALALGQSWVSHSEVTLINMDK